jgi:nitrogen fixation protein NifU and related proteins
MQALYSAELLDHFERPRNSGLLEGADLTVQVENPVCGDVLRLMAKVSAGRISEIRFLAQGCVPAIACGSALTELAAGKTLAEARSIRREELMRKLGGLPEASTHASHLAIDALRALLATTPSGAGYSPRL